MSVEWSRGIEDAWAQITTFVPKLVAFLAIVIIGYLIAKLIAKIADRALERLGFDRAVERGGIRRALEHSNYDPSDIVATLIFYALMLLVLQMGFGIFGPNPVSDLLSGVVAYLPKVIAAIIIIVLAAAIAAAARELIATALGALDYGRALATAAGIAIVGVGVFAALNQLEIGPAIVNGLFYAILTTITGSLIIAIGGGGIAPMRQRRERALARYDEEAPPRIRDGLRNRPRRSQRTRPSDRSCRQPAVANA
jgi:hypothetical protein